MAYYRVTVAEDYDYVALPNGVVLAGGESANLTSRYFYLIPEVNHDILFSNVEEFDSSGGGGGMNSEDFVAEEPLVWDSETTTLTLSLNAEDIGDSTATGRSLITAVGPEEARTAIGAGTSDLELGSTASTAAAGNHVHAQYLEATQAAAVADASGDAEATVNNLLASLRAAGILDEV